MWHMCGLILLGIGAGILSGLFGIGGGIIIVPALIYLFGFSSHLAQGTSLAVLIPPIGILAVWTYYQKGDVNISAAALIACGFLVSSVIGSKFALGLPDATLRRIFAVFLMAIAARMFFQGSKIL